MSAAHPLTEAQIEALKTRVQAWGDSIQAWRQTQPVDTEGHLPHVMKEEADPTDRSKVRLSAQTSEDRRLGQEIIDFLQSLSDTPYPVLQEEQPEHINRAILARASAAAKRGQQEASTFWTVDPIDGTSNFMSPGKKKYGILIGLAREGKPVFGMTYMPEFGLMTYVGADGKAYQQIKGEAPKELSIAEPEADQPLSISRYVSDHLKKLAEADPSEERLSHVTRLARGVKGLNIGHRLIRAIEEGASIASSFLPNGLALSDKTTIAESDIPQLYDEIPMLNGSGDVARLTGGSIWDYVGRDAVLRAAGAAMFSARTGAPIAYTSDPRDASPLYCGETYIAHPNTMQSLDVTPEKFSLPVTGRLAGV